MKKTFIKTKNVKNFSALMEELKTLPPNMSKIALVYGECGLGKTQTILWWATKNDAIYVRAKRGMCAKWLLAQIVEELNFTPNWHTQYNFELIEKSLSEYPRTIIIDEIDYLIDKNTIESLRDLQDVTKCPLVLVGMENIDKKLRRLPHLCDRIYKSFKFEKYDTEDIRVILKDLTDLEFSDDGIEYLATRANQFRQIVKLINKIEKLADMNEIEVLNEYNLKGLLNERTNITAMQKVG